MSIAISTTARALGVLSAVAIYTTFSDGLSPQGKHLGTATTTTAGLEKEHILSACNDAVNLANFVQIYIAFELVRLYFWPLWRLRSPYVGVARFAWYVVTHWGAALVVYLGVMALREYLDIY